MIREFTDNESMDKLLPLVQAWKESCKANDFEVEINLGETGLDLQNLIESDDCTLLFWHFKNHLRHRGA